MRSASNTNSTHDGVFLPSRESCANYALVKALLQTCDVNIRIRGAYHFTKNTPAMAALLPLIGDLWARSHVPNAVYSGEDMTILTTVEMLQYGTGRHPATGGNGLSRWEQEARSGNWSCRDWEDEHNEVRVQCAA